LIALLSAAAGLVAVGWLAFANWGPRGGEWGPLAVSRFPMGGDAALISGVLRVADRCVVLETESGDRALLVWSADFARWDDERNQIVFRNPDGQLIELRDGQSVSLGGSGVLFSDGDGDPDVTTREEWIATVDWAAVPDTSCTADRSWSVGQVVVDG
jgi:hypothetical protein